MQACTSFGGMRAPAEARFPSEFAVERGLFTNFILLVLDDRLELRRAPCSNCTVHEVRQNHPAKARTSNWAQAAGRGPSPRRRDLSAALYFPSALYYNGAGR